MSFIVFKSDGNDIIINSDKIVAVTIERNNKKTLIQTENHFFTVNESMDEVKKILKVKTKTIGKKGPSLESLSSRI